MRPPPLRLILCVLSVLVLWDMKPVFYFIWKPFTWLVGYVDPRKPSDDVLYGAWGWGSRGACGMGAPTVGCVWRDVRALMCVCVCVCVCKHVSELT